MPTPDDLTTSQSEECPRADHALPLERYKTPHDPLQGRTHSLEGVSPLWPAYLAKQYSSFFLLHPQL